MDVKERPCRQRSLPCQRLILPTPTIIWTPSEEFALCKFNYEWLGNSSVIHFKYLFKKQCLVKFKIILPLALLLILIIFVLIYSAQSRAFETRKASWQSHNLLHHPKVHQKGGHAVHPVIQGLAGTGPAPLVVNPVVVAATLHLAHVN